MATAFSTSAGQILIVLAIRYTHAYTNIAFDHSFAVLLYHISMTPLRPKRKTAVLSLRVSPPVKAAAELAAERDHRSVASFIEVLIRNHCKANEISVENENLKGDAP